MKRLVLAVFLAASAAGLTGCGGSGTSTKSQAGTPSASVPASVAATSIHNYNNATELAAALRDQWAKEMADPQHAHYVPGGKVKNLVCKPETQPHFFTCTMTPTKGDAKTQRYLASPDGQLFEGVENAG